MTKTEIKSKIEDLTKRASNKSLPASAVASLNKMIADLKSQLDNKVIEEGLAEHKGGSTTAKEEKDKLKKEGYKEKSGKFVKEAKETKKESKNDYDCDELIKDAKLKQAKRKAAAEKRAEAPKKTEVTKAKEKIERAHESIEKQIKAGKFKKPQLQKLIEETKDLLKLLESKL